MRQTYFSEVYCPLTVDSSFLTLVITLVLTKKKQQSNHIFRTVWRKYIRGPRAASVGGKGKLSEYFLKVHRDRWSAGRDLKSYQFRALELPWSVACSFSERTHPRMTIRINGQPLAYESVSSLAGNDEALSNAKRREHWNLLVPDSQQISPRLVSNFQSGGGKDASYNAKNEGRLAP